MKTELARVSRRGFLRAGSLFGALTLMPLSYPASSTRRALGGVSLGDGPAFVRSYLGAPALETIAHGNGSPEWRYDGLRVQFFTEHDGPRVGNIVLQSARAGATDKNVRVGDPQAAVFATYGTGVIDDHQGSLTVAVDPTTRLNFEVGRDQSLTAISLRRLDCDTCFPIVIKGPAPKKP